MTPNRRSLHPLFLIGFVAGAAIGVAFLAATRALAADSLAVESTVAAADDLGPTSDPPWNPPRALPRRETWEQVLDFPGRVVSLPFSGLGIVLEHTLHHVEETSLIALGSHLAMTFPMRTGLMVLPAELGDRTGLGAKFALSTPYLPGIWRNVITGEISGSTLRYNSTRLRFGGDNLNLAYGYDWRPQEQFFGVGRGTDDDSVSNYAAQQEYVRAVVGLHWNRRDDGPGDRTRLEGWAGPRARIMRKGHESGRPSFEEYYPVAALPTLDDQLEYFIYGGSFDTDWRTGGPHWSRGWRLHVMAENYGDPPSWAAINDARGRGATFTRWGAEFETGFSFMRDPRTVRVMVKFVDQVVTEGAERFVVADLVKLGGAQGLWGFEPGRFHDLDAFLTRAAYVFPLSRRFEINLHAEGGAVYHDVWENLSLDTWEHSWGAYLRARTKTQPVASFGADFSREGFRIRYSIGNVD